MLRNNWSLVINLSKLIESRAKKLAHERFRVIFNVYSQVLTLQLTLLLLTFLLFLYYFLFWFILWLFFLNVLLPVEHEVTYLLLVDRLALFVLGWCHILLIEDLVQVSV